MFFGEKYINFIVYKPKDRTAKKHVIGSCVVLYFFRLSFFCVVVTKSDQF